RGGEAGLVGAAVALPRLAHDARAGRRRDLRRPVGRGVVDDDDLVDDRGHLLEHGTNAVLLVVARDDDADPLPSIHVASPWWTAAQLAAGAVACGLVPHVPSVARTGFCPVSRRHALRTLRLDHSFRT